MDTKKVAPVALNSTKKHLVKEAQVHIHDALRCLEGADGILKNTRKLCELHAQLLDAWLELETYTGDE